MMINNNREASSFRDPSGFLFRNQGVLYRQINTSYKDNFDLLMDSGLYKKLVDSHLLISHKDIGSVDGDNLEIVYKIIQPVEIKFISYPYEWSFSQLKDAALLTLDIQKSALESDMSLKDASAYNIQFSLETGKPILIDTLSFEKYPVGQPWIAYRQFCQHFLGPLALMSFTDVRLNQLLKSYIDGIPLDLVSKLLPFKTKWNFGILSHIHLHALAQKKFAGESGAKSENTKREMSKLSLLGLIDSLERTINKLQWNPTGTEWGEYYEDTNYSTNSWEHKKLIISDFLATIQPKFVWDIGANTGIYSRIASQKDIPTISFDIDPAAVEKNYLDVKKNREEYLLPLVLDVTNPSPDIGWDNKERGSIKTRTAPDTIMALALIHHLAISNNLPLELIAEYFQQLSKWLVIEFVPKEDSQVQRLLSSREDIFPLYTIEGFEDAFSKYFNVIQREPIEESSRLMYLMERK